MIFGDFKAAPKAGGVDTSDATATAADIASGVTAYVDGEKLTGTHGNNMRLVKCRTEEGRVAQGAPPYGNSAVYKIYSKTDLASGEVIFPFNFYSIGGAQPYINVAVFLRFGDDTISVIANLPTVGKCLNESQTFNLYNQWFTSAGDGLTPIGTCTVQNAGEAGLNATLQFLVNFTDLASLPDEMVWCVWNSALT